MASKAESPIAPPISEQNLSGKKIGVVLGIPSRGSVRLEWAAMLKSVTEPINMSWAIKTTIGKPVDQARNMIARYAIEFNANYLLFIDDDVLIPNQGLRRLVYQMEQNPDWDLLSGIYVTRTGPTGTGVSVSSSRSPVAGWAVALSAPRLSPRWTPPGSTTGASRTARTRWRKARTSISAGSWQRRVAP
jgi:hypothetical protein